ncbi:hypothetical protein TSAR_014726, partial [Trichomalopsis sarcophagae]
IHVTIGNILQGQVIICNIESARVSGQFRNYERFAASKSLRVIKKENFAVQHQRIQD